MSAAITLRQWGKRWLAQRATMPSHGNYESNWLLHIHTAPFARKALADITRREVREWSRALLEKPSSKKPATTIAVGTARNVLNLLRGALNDALEDELISANPAADVRLRRERSFREAAENRLPLVSVKGLLAVLPPTAARATCFAAYTGLRAGEQRSLHLNDVHLDGTIDGVPCSHVVVRYGSPRQPTKSGHPRVVPLLPAAERAVREQLDSLDDAANPSGLLFPALRGGYRTRGRLIDLTAGEWRRACKLAGITRHVRWHDLRHTCASLLLSGALGAEWSLEAVKEMLGHASITTTERYTRSVGGLAARAARDMRRAERAIAS
jgi:integrase